MYEHAKEFEITPKGLIYAILTQYSDQAEVIVDEIWNKLYEYGCEEIGEIGLPALVIEKYASGEFIPSFIEPEDDEFYLDEDEEDGYGY